MISLIEKAVTLLAPQVMCCPNLRIRSFSSTRSALSFSRISFLSLCDVVLCRRGTGAPVAGSTIGNEEPSVLRLLFDAILSK